METLKTGIEFVSSGTGGGGGTSTGEAVNAAAAATGTGATVDPLFSVCAILVAFVVFGASLFLYARYNKKNAAITMATNARPSVRLQSPQTKGSSSLIFLIVAVIIIIAATCFSICGQENAIAQESSPSINGNATISDKVKANVDDSGAVTFEKGIITNNDKDLFIGVRQIKSTTTVDLSDSSLQIMCNNQELFNATLGETQLNDSYIKVAAKGSADLIYAINIPAEKAKALIDTQPITLSTCVDLLVSKSGTVVDASGKKVEKAKVTYSYPDPYDDTKLITGETITDENGEYIIPDVKKDKEVQIVISYTDTKTEPARSYSADTKVTFGDESEIPSSSFNFKVDPISADLVFTAPKSLVYDGTEKQASFTVKESSPCPQEMKESITYKYSTDKISWTASPINVGEYYVCAEISGGGSWTPATLTDNNWKFKITSKEITVPVAGNTTSKEYNGTEQSVEGFTAAIPEGETATIALAEGKTAKATGTKAGEYPMGLTSESFQETTGNYNVTFNVTDGKLTITKKAINVSVAGTTSTKEYNGTEQSVEGFNATVPEGETAQIALAEGKTAIASGTDVGDYLMGLTSASFKETTGNYNVTFNVTDGKLTIKKKTTDVSITLDSDSGRCKFNASKDFSVKTASGFGSEEENITYSAPSSVGSVTVTPTTTAVGMKATFTVTASDTEATENITVTAESPNYKTTTTYKITVGPPAYYTGTVKLFSISKPEGVGAGGASVSFENASGAITDTTTSSREEGKIGTFTLTKTEETTPGKIKVTYAGTTDADIYSVAIKTTTTGSEADQGTFEIRKLSSLSVKVYQYDSSGKNPGLKDRFWAPAFSDGSLTKSSIKFYDSSYCEINGYADEGKKYRMSDLYDSKNKTSKGQYYAFVTTGVTLRCYQTADQTWSATFKINSEGSSYPQNADALVDNWNSDGSVCGDSNASTVYFNTSDSSTWLPSAAYTTKPVPKVNSQLYNTWYNAYGIRDGGVLAYYSYYPWSAVACSNSEALYWYTFSSGWGPVSRDDEHGSVVLYRVFTS